MSTSGSSSSTDAASWHRGGPLTAPTDPGNRIVVGTVKRPHGVGGAVLVAPATDHPGRFSVGSMIAVDGGPPVAIVRAQPHPEGVIVYLDGVTDRNAAESLRRRPLTIGMSDRRPLGDDEFWSEDLVGLPATTTGGEALGTVTDVVLGGAQDRLVVTTGGGEVIEVPFVAAIVPVVSPGGVVIDPPGGLFPGR